MKKEKTNTLLLAKIKLYKLLLKKDANEISNSEATLLVALAGDDGIQGIIRTNFEEN